MAAKSKKKSGPADTLAIVGWALFFIWIGVALLLNVGFHIGLLGVGIIILAMQGVRLSSKQKLEWGWVVVGLLFVIGGLGGLFEMRRSLMPILFIVAGVVLIISIIIKGKK